MILIYSTEIEDSTSCVIDWLIYKGEKFIRINNGNIDEFILNIHLSNQKFNISLKKRAYLILTQNKFGLILDLFQKTKVKKIKTMIQKRL